MPPRRSGRHPAGMTGLEAAIARAVECDEFVLHYQPIVTVRTGDIAAYEALVRWARPGSEMLPPAEFIPVAEVTDLIVRVDTWVINQAARQLAQWNHLAKDRSLVVAVNVSGRHINTPHIRTNVAAALDANDIDPGQLILEITETVVVDGSAVDNLHELRRLGVKLSLDDLGTGHNSIDQLTRLPLDIVKIDRSYLDPAAPSRRRELRQLVDAAHALGLPVCGEGVEQEDQLTLLRELGVESAQGFFLGRPTTAAAVGAGLKP